MKTLENIFKSVIVDSVGPVLDSLQFAYRPGRSVDDAKLFILNAVHEHLCKATLFPSAFKTVQPYVLLHFNLDQQFLVTEPNQ